MKVDSLYTGTPQLVEGIRYKTGISKSKVQSICVFDDHIEGDAVANLKHHGGVNRVLHHYPIENYNYWKNLFDNEDYRAGSFGENLSTFGLTEEEVCIGDTYRIGEVECIVTEPRKPCGTIDLKMGEKGLARKIQEEARTGWFYRIIKPGKINVDDELELLERPYPELTIKKCVVALLLNKDRETLKYMINNPILSNNWKVPANKLLLRNEMKDDSLRLGDRNE